MIGQTLNKRYKITARLGKGAMGTVYRATDSQTSQEVALKVISGELSINPEMLERFKREGEALRQLKHPNIVEFLDAFEHEEEYVIVMEYVSGGSLHELISKGPLPIKDANRIALELCDALIRSHHLNIIHRDLKPENVLITKDGTPKLADFGVARLNEGTRMTRTGTQVGTPYYMAPEAWEGKPLDAQADIWSLGVILFEMLTGQVPFGGETGAAVMNKVLTAQHPKISTLRNDTPSGIARIVNRMLTRDKKRRYQTMREIAVDLERNRSSPVSQLEKTTPSSIQLKRMIYAVPVIAGLIFSYQWLKPDSAQPSTNVPTSNNVIAQETNTPKPSTPSAVPTAGLGIGSTVQGVDGANLLYIPEGEFIMGSANGQADELPVRNITLDAYWMDETEVTNGRYEQCVQAGACAQPFEIHSSTNPSYYGNEEFKEYPVLFVDWEMANTYCTWANRRLPSEAEWEKAARGKDDRNYPWGNSFDMEKLNTCDINCLESWANLAFDDGYAHVAPVGSYSNGKSPFRILDMLGNVWEWNNDYYARYDQSPSASNPIGPATGTKRILRGGGWDLDGIFRVSDRYDADPFETANNIGFRCAKDFEESDLISLFGTTTPSNTQPTATKAFCATNSNAEAFSKPILDSLAGAEPTFQDDFSTTGNGWEETRVAGAWESGTMEIVDGVLRFSDVIGQNISDTGSWSFAQDFVFEVDQKLTAGINSTEQRITFHLNPTGENDYAMFSLQIYQKAGYWTFNKIQKTSEGDIAEGRCGLNPSPESNRFTVVVQKNEFALLVNGTPIYYLQDDDLFEPGWMHLLCLSRFAAVCEWDNVKFWNLNK